MNPAKRHEIFSRLRAVNPHPTTELEYRTPFELLVAVVLSAQSTDKGVNLATRRLFPVANTPESIHALGEEGLADFIRTIGLYKSKARHLIAACKMLIELHGSQVPAERAAFFLAVNVRAAARRRVEGISIEGEYSPGSAKAQALLNCC